MISRGDANTRERDYADFLALSKIHAVEAHTLRHALEETAAHRYTQLTPLTEAIDTLPTTRQRDWRAFLERSGLPAMPESFARVLIGREEPAARAWRPLWLKPFMASRAVWEAHPRFRAIFGARSPLRLARSCPWSAAPL
jgi:hypothetical protein